MSTILPADLNGEHILCTLPCQLPCELPTILACDSHPSEKARSDTLRSIKFSETCLGLEFSNWVVSRSLARGERMSVGLCMQGHF